MSRDLYSMVLSYGMPPEPGDFVSPPPPKPTLADELRELSVGAAEALERDYAELLDHLRAQAKTGARSYDVEGLPDSAVARLEASGLRVHPVVGVPRLRRVEW